MLCVASWLTLQSPAWLALAILAVGPVVACLLARRAGRTPSTAASVLQSTALALLAVALARPAMTRTADEPLPWLVLQDASASLTGQQLTAIPPAAEVVRFADRLLPPGQTPSRAVTRLAPALQLAAGRIAAGRVGGAILATDGRFHDAWAPAATALGQLEAPLLIVPHAAPDDDARIATITAKRTAAGRARLRIDLAANAPLRRTLTITPAGSTAPLARRKVTLQPGQAASVHLDVPAPPGRTNTWQAALTPADALPNDTAATILAPSQRPTAWIAPADAPPLPKLHRPTIRLSPAEAPTTPAGWTRYGAAIANPAELPAASRAALARAAAMGTGLILTTIDPNTPTDAPLTAIAPLIPSARQRNPLDLVVLLDASGSMARPAGKGMRFDLAREGLLALRGDLSPADGLAVWTFARQVQPCYTAPPGQIDFAGLAETLDAIAPTGPTDIAPALQALADRQPAEGATGLILALTDQDVAPFDATELADRLARGGWKLAIVAAGPQTAGPLAELTRRMAGRATLVRAESLTGLAELFGSLIRTARGPAATTRRVTITTAPTMTGLATLGPSLAVTPTRTRTGATVIARADAEPLAAVAPVGLGRVASLAIAPGQTAGQPLPAEAADDLLRAVTQESDPRYSLDVSRAGEQLRLDLSAPQRGLALRALLQPAEPGSEARQAELQQVGPFRYRATLTLPSDQAAGLVVAHDRSAVVREVIPARAGPELLSGADWTALGELADRTGGRIVPADQLPAELGRIARAGRLQLWPIALAAALTSMLLAWLVHRPG